MRFTTELRVESKDHIASAVGRVGEQVRSRTGADRRTADDRDWWCFRRWLFTLGQNDLLFYPFTVTRPEEGGPDFLMTYEIGNCGLEITEATNAEDQRERTLSELRATGPYTMGDFGGRTYVATSEEQLQSDYTAQIFEALDRKLAKAGRYLARCECLDFMIYVNNNAGTFVPLADVASALSDGFAQRIVAAGREALIGRTTVLDHREMLVVLDGSPRLLQTLEGPDG